MKFGDLPIDAAEGALLAHALKAEGIRLKKGHRLRTADIEALKAAGIREIVALTLDPGDEPEDAAAARLAEALHADGVTIGEATTGRVNIHAAANGLFRIDRSLVDELNRIDPAITFACLADRAQVREGEMVATIKIIPLAVSGSSLAEAAMVVARPGLLAVRPFTAHRVGLIATELPTLKKSVMDKTRDLLQARLDPAGSEVIGEQRVPHRAEAVAAALEELSPESDMLIVFGASAVIDPEDVIPAAIRRAGGTVESVGMPVDPGNLLVLGSLDGKPVVGAPGCARSPKENGFDWVLTRLLAGETVSRDDIAGMGVGGLLMEIPSRPQPRNDKARAADVRVEAVLLAAGKASRMGVGGAHKLLADFDGEPLVRRCAEAAVEAGVGTLHVVTGHRGEEIEAALSGVDCHRVHNPAYEEGMASSLVAGLSALGSDAAGLLVMLADMPGVTADHLKRMTEAFRRAGGRAIVRATAGEKRGNPVILPRATFAAIRQLQGDVGARQIVETSGLEVIDVDIGAAAHLDVDTPEAIRAAGGIIRG